MKINSENHLINDIYQYDVVLLWMDINNSMSKGFLKYIDVNFPELKYKEIKSGYGDLRKLGTINNIKSKNITFCACYIYKNNEILLKLLEECSKAVKNTYTKSRIAAIQIFDNEILQKLFDNLDITFYNKEIIDFNLYYYREFNELRTKYKNGIITKEEYTKLKNKLKSEQKNGIY
jgi:hypothetical protein